MLIKVFGLWLVAANIQALEPPNTIFGWSPMGKCFIRTGSFGGEWSDHTCEEVAAEINRQQEKTTK